MSIGDFNEMMSGLDDIAKDTGLSVQAVQQNLTEFIKTSAQLGGSLGGAEAARQFPGLEDSLAGLSIARNGQLGGFLSGGLTQ